MKAGFKSIAGLCWLALVLASLALPAFAHVGSAPADRSGVAIASVSHGEMAILNRYRDEIMALAEKADRSDATLSALVFFAGMQSANCFWELIPGSLTDEASPLNECAHADMAATKEIVLRLRARPETAVEAGALASRIDVDMTLAGASLVQCAFSGEGFNTASPVTPDWRAVWSYLLDRFGVAILLGVGLAAILWGMTSRFLRPTPKTP